MAGKPTRVRRFAFRGQVVIVQTRNGVRDVLVPGRPAPRGAPPLPKDLRTAVAEELDRPPAPQVLGRRGQTLPSSREDRANAALERMRRGDKDKREGH